ncbi:MAG: four-carbon acid sugar kinase family protein [Cytophagales bacterium]|nr:four-carbon acid sugar kinase family protein [Cytophagales bacterium]
MEINNNMLKLAYYGDDFTGSTDVMESLSLAGIPTALFLEPQDIEEVNKFQFRNQIYQNQHIQAAGVAGISRTYTLDQTNDILPGIFQKICTWNAQYFHYKICSTFDSSPTVGSIGRALEIAKMYFYAPNIPLLVGAPHLNRYVVFGNLYARIHGTTHRLDRHPTMSKHPITPMNESDLLIHLQKQTALKSKLLDIWMLENHDISKIWGNINLDNDGDIILFDTLYPSHLKTIGQLISQTTSQNNRLLVGSSAVENALFPNTHAANNFKNAGKADTLLVMSGSCSPVTAEQIQYAEHKGFNTLAIDATKLLNESERASEMQRVAQWVLQSMQSKTPTICYSALGPDDESVHKVKNIKGGQEMLPVLQGQLFKNIIQDNKPRRVIAVGGDTSGKISQILGINALEFLMPLAPGAPMCISHAHDNATDNLQIILKGGQNGDATFFEKAYNGVV